MKKLFTLCIALLFSCVAMNAQNFIFVDGDGNTIENGATLTMDQVSYKEDFVFNPDGSYEIIQVPMISLSGVYIKNNSAESQSCKVTYNVTALPNGSFAACCAENCSNLDSEGTIEKNANADAGKTIDISTDTEWVPVAAGTTTVKISAQGSKSMLPDSEITINFIYDGTASIDGIQNNADNKVVARYSINGQLLDTPQKGINILKYADGRIEKVIVK
ncbi:hypothetical protein [Prevotella marseillensis]|uniref:hypothetical protein n=1 Tax=Prevotella marseillensis TaxID=2479840 RepID=UPI000F642841|nr:hypothetical protein [Prevotella marseillensis]